MSQNLLVNPGFEIADPSASGYSGVTLPGWTVTGTPTVIPYGSPRPFFPSPFGSPFPDLPKFLGFPQHAPSGGGNNFAGGGPVATSTISQTVNLTGAAGTPYTLSADLGGRLLNPSSASVHVTFYSSTGAVLGTGSTRVGLAAGSPGYDRVSAARDLRDGPRRHHLRGGDHDLQRPLPDPRPLQRRLRRQRVVDRRQYEPHPGAAHPTDVHRRPTSITCS